jgi:dTDP-4-amino-4,6-dideoxygalactose transaminase
VDLGAFRALADRQGLLLVEDAAQAHGARWGGTRVGSVGDVATFSFFPGKNLGAIGDAGAVTTSDADLAQRVRLLRDHGRTEKYVHEIVGTNARLDTLQAAVLLAKLPSLDGWNDARRAHAAAYDSVLADVGGVEPIRTADGAEAVYHQYVARVRDRAGAVEHLASRGVSTGIHYPVPLHRQPAFAELRHDAAYANADSLADEVLSLPVYPELAPDARARVLEALVEHAARAEQRSAAPMGARR